MIRGSVHHVWPIPLYQSRLDPVDPITYAYLVNQEFSNFGDENFTHLETPNRFLLNLPKLNKLKSQIQEHIDYFVHDVIGASRNQKWEITTSWINKSFPNGYHPNHWHSNALISGVWYMKAPKDCGDIEFHKDRGHTNLWRDTFCIDFEKTTTYQSPVSIEPVENELLMFPSLLNHNVAQNKSKEERYSLAFNVFPRGIIGQGGNSEITL
jgi:uncharacterized protein (TIGR02466 family)